MSFEMFTKAGNSACQTQLNKIIKFIKNGKGVTPETINTMYENALEKISIKHPEVNDTEPEWHLKDRIKKALQENYFDKSIFFN
jgi:Asp-tRNA(Asn)/Glu-tRNA(Gln) amidotransferase C subunit